MEKVPFTEFTWCLELCKEEVKFKRKTLNLKSDVTGKLIQKFKEARTYWKCTKCGKHSVERAKSQFIHCDNCNAIFHGICSGKDLNDEEVCAAPFRCTLCTGEAFE